MKNRLIQFHGSSSFNSLSQNIPFYHSTTTPLKPYLAKGIGEIPTVLDCATAQKYGRKAEQQKGFTKPTEIVAVVVFFFCFVRFSSNKSLNTTYFFLMVIKNTLLLSQRHSLDWNNTALLANPTGNRMIFSVASIGLSHSNKLNSGNVCSQVL